MGVLSMEGIVIDATSNINNNRVHKRASLQLHENQDVTCVSGRGHGSHARSVSRDRYTRSNSAGQQISIRTLSGPDGEGQQEFRITSDLGPVRMTHSRSQQTLRGSGFQGQGYHGSQGQGYHGSLVSLTNDGHQGYNVHIGSASNRHSFGGSGQWMYMGPETGLYNDRHNSMQGVESRDYRHSMLGGGIRHNQGAMARHNTHRSCCMYIYSIVYFPCNKRSCIYIIYITL